MLSFQESNHLARTQPSEHAFVVTMITSKQVNTAQDLLIMLLYNEQT